MAEAGDVVSICQLCRWLDVPRRTFYYRQVKQKPKVNELLAARIKQFIEGHSYAGYRTIAHNLGLSVVAEGVETQQQLDYLRARGCDLAQGYLISRPVPAGEVMAFIRQHNG